MEGKAKAWKTLGAYNRRDVTVLEPLYELLRPWVVNHPNVSVLHEGLACPKCGSKKTQHRGEAVTATQVYKRLHCQSCGGWFRSNKKIGEGREERGVNIAV
jgi:DNA-directed RNA polymerase subunit RPC12/RpoP